MIQYIDPFDLYKKEVMKILQIDALSAVDSSLLFACYKNNFTPQVAAEELESFWYSPIEEDYNFHGNYD
jgi:hypothetical protein